MSKKKKSSIGTDPFKEKEDILKGFFKSEAPELQGDSSVVSLPQNDNSISSRPPAPGPQSPSSLDPEMQSLIKDFAAEVKENLDEIDSSLVALESDPKNEELLNKVFRVMHTIKGSAGFLNFERMQRLSHRAEDLLNKLRNKEMVLNPEINDAILTAGDILKKLLHEVETDGKERTDVTAAIENLSAILEGKTTPSPTLTPTLSQREREREARGEEAKSAVSSPLTSPHRGEGQSLPPKSLSGGEGSMGKEPLPHPLPSVPSPQPQASSLQPLPSSAAPQVKISSSTIRIDVDKLDALMNLAGELVLSRNRQVLLAKNIASKYPQDEAVTTELSASANQLDLLTADIQIAVMKTRMLPVSTLFDKFTRVVRDLSRMLGKEVDLLISGGDTEIDKNILEGLGDPMVHLVRNSLDHGIESPQDRINKGKNRRGTVSLNSYHEGGYVVIEIKDDGKGIDPVIIKNKAVEKGIIGRAEADSMPDKEALKLIFAPGFSTAEKISNVSGRGVGMDVVKTNVESLKGIIEVDSIVGKGSTVRLLIPLTLAILQTLLCNLGGQKLAIPLISIKETLEISDSEITTIRGQEVMRLRDEVLPILRLANVFEINQSAVVRQDHHDHPEPVEGLSIIVLQLGYERIGLVVDERLGKEEVVVKSLTCLKDIYTPPHISGATILGDGTVTLILDVESIVKLATQNRVKQAEGEVKGEVKGEEEEGYKALIVDDGMAEQYAIPLKLIKKVELISAGEIEHVGNKEVVKYYNEALPVTRLYYLTKYPPVRQFQSVYMLIVSEGGRRGGLITNRMHGLKWIKQSGTTDSFTNTGVLRSVIIDNRVTLILNDKMIIENIYSENFERNIPSPAIKLALSKVEGSEAGKVFDAADVYKSKKTILLVDDSSTHRSIQGKVVQEAGYDVIYAEDGEEGLKKLAGVSLVLTDLEMPKMNGYELTKNIKKINPGMPVVMLTSRDGEEDRLMGLEAGVDEYLTKMNKDELIYAIKRFIG